MRMAVGAGDIPGTTDMGSILRRSSEPTTEADVSQCAAGTLGRAPGMVCGPVRLTSCLPFSPYPAPGPGVIQISPEGEGAARRGNGERGTSAVTFAAIAAGADVAPTTARGPGTTLEEATGPVGGVCPGGNLDGEAAFSAQAGLAAQATGWYRHYVSLLRRLTSGHTPVALVTSCGQGGVVEGVRRAGGASHGQDRSDQPRYRSRRRSRHRRQRRCSRRRHENFSIHGLETIARWSAR